MSVTAVLNPAVRQWMARGRDARAAGNTPAAWEALAMAHIIAQPQLGLHLRVHTAMLLCAVATRNLREVMGQALRLLLTPLGHVSGRIPWGNSGLSNVSPFASAPLPDEVKALYIKAGIRISDYA